MATFLPVENHFRRTGFKVIAGVDEAGRGPLAGPVVSACVILKDKARLPGLRDSKLLSHRQRIRLFDLVLKNALDYAIAAVSHLAIDRYNILNAVRMANDLCVRELIVKPDLVLCDGRDKQIIDLPFCNIIKGDRLVKSIAAASVLAKVARDKMMIHYDADFPEYLFAKHKGYGTRQHRKLIIKNGPCVLHRKSFKVSL